MSIILAYWNIRGLAEPIRMLLNYAEVDFEDKRLDQESMDDLTSLKQELGLDISNLPFLVDGEVKLSHSFTIIRYLARKNGLIPSGEEAIQRAELVEQQIVDIRIAHTKICYNNTEYEKLRPEFVATALPNSLALLSSFLGDRKWMAGDELSYVDFLVYEGLDVFRLFHPPCLDDHENLLNYLKRFEELPTIAKYMASDRYHRFPVNGAKAAWGGQRE